MCRMALRSLAFILQIYTHFPTKAILFFSLIKAPCKWKLGLVLGYNDSINTPWYLELREFLHHSYHITIFKLSIVSLEVCFYSLNIWFYIFLLEITWNMISHIFAVCCVFQELYWFGRFIGISIRPNRELKHSDVDMLPQKSENAALVDGLLQICQPKSLSITLKSKIREEFIGVSYFSSLLYNLLIIKSTQCMTARRNNNYFSCEFFASITVYKWEVKGQRRYS